MSPERSLCPSIWAAMQRKRSASSSFDCSRLKRSTPWPERAIPSAQLQMRAVFPMLGRAARMISSAG